MARLNTVLTIDIGGCSLKVAEFFFSDNGGMELSRYEFVEYPIADSDTDFIRNLSEAMSAVFASCKFQARDARISVSGQNFFTRLSSLPPVLEKRSHIDQIVEFEARQTVPYPIEEVVWDYQLIHHATGNGDDGLGLADEMEAIFVAVKEDLLVSVTDIVEDFNLNILSVEIAPTSFFNAARANAIGNDQCEVILNIGGRCSNLVFADHGRIFSRTIPIAGHSITQQIAKEFNISFEDAEELKRRHCFVALGGVYEEPDSQVAATISKIARNVMTRLHGEVNRSINVWRSQHGGNKPARMLLCGGSSIIPYTPHFFNEKLHIPVEYLNVFHVVALNPELDREKLLADAPLMPDSVGLALRHAIDCPVEVSLLPQSVRFQQNFKSKRIYFYFAIVLVFLCLLVIHQVADIHMKRAHNQVENVRKSVEVALADAAELSKVSRELDAVKSSYDNIQSLMNKRGEWLRIMAELENIKPDNVWFASVVPISEEDLSLLDSASGAGSSGVMGGVSVSQPGRRSNSEDSMVDMESPVISGEIEELTEVSYIEIIGHWVYEDIASDQTIATLKDRIKKSRLFEIEDPVLHCTEQSGADKANVGEFRLFLHFTEPITL